ncbi:MAG: phage terminase large subunit [Candidatus Omnitrophica bacterium]|nr:phage terminase large subunit [Candidatus Omnitrophota bacterium]MBU1047042.1 phage terminase large subunit [Candidatus Omnitrophota bacterium]MBU1630718.1 phage terminase large subunit [Candidatus Omnitrophota bacterium]MBU1889288.1 phage terminase large subunit [Candidatus Omnitrophota bacterium]
MNNLSKDIISLRRNEAETSIYAFAKLYLPDHLKIKPSKAHLEVYDLLLQATREKSKKIAIAAPRDFGKSTMITLIYAIYLICYNKERFIVIISNVESQAQKTLENIRKELTENERLQEDFPEIFENEGRPKPPRWTQSDIITRNNIEILALGYNQKIRGRRHGAYRPGLIILDDLEPDAGWSSPEMASKMKDWLNKAVFKAGSETTNYIFMGTISHWISVLGEYLQEDSNPTWIKRKYKALIEWPSHMNFWARFFNIRDSKEQYKGKKGIEGANHFYNDNKHIMDEGAVLLWPEKWDLLNLMQMYDDNKFSFASEMQNDPYNLSEITFDVDNFSYWTDEYPTVDVLLKFLGRDVRFYGACDPATGKSRFTGDYSAIIILACKGGFYYVIVADIARRTPDRLTKDIIAYAKRYPFSKFIVESNNFQELMVQSVEKEAKDARVSPRIERKNNNTRKTDRIFSLYDWVKNGTIKFSKNDRLLLDQFRAFPQQGKSDDGPDALEMAFKHAQKSPQIDTRGLSILTPIVNNWTPRNDGMTPAWLLKDYK